MELVSEKTQLLAFQNKNFARVNQIDTTDTVHINGVRIPFSNEAEHLGVLRSSHNSNSTSIMHRISAYRKQLFSLLPAGLASHHRCNPAISLKVEKLYCLPVLLSGLNALALNKTDLSLVRTYRKKILARLMKLPDATPEPAVCFLAGTLPTSAYIHLRQLSLFAMVCHQGNNILTRHAENVLLTSSKLSKSWFYYLRDICMMYELPHPLQMLSEPPFKESFKTLCRSKIYEYWHKWLCSSTSSLSSLVYLRAPFLALNVPHPIWTSLDSNPYQAKAAAVQALFLSGRYRSERLHRHWTPNNRGGFCRQLCCLNLKNIEDEQHILLHCTAYINERRRLKELSTDMVNALPIIKPILDAYLYDNHTDENIKLQFLLDCSTLPLVIVARQTFGVAVLKPLFKFTRTWCLTIHRRRLKLLGHPLQL